MVYRILDTTRYISTPHLTRRMTRSLVTVLQIMNTQIQLCAGVYTINMECIMLQCIYTSQV